MEDFSSWVKLKLIEDNYSVFRQFRGRCALSTYLSIVVQRLLSDYRNHLWGKWRPSARSERLGPLAVKIETLIARDGRSRDEAFRDLRSRGDTVTRAEFDAIASGIVDRRLRPRAVDLDEVSEALTTSAESIESDAERPERRAVAQEVGAALRAGLARLAAEDRAILRMHFGGGMRVAEIARSLQADQKQLYRRIERICECLRGHLLAAGIDADKANEIIGRPDVSLDFGLHASGNPAAGPSSTSKRGGDAEDHVSR